jgi:Fe-S-cluster-containing hydrogenase component 2
MLRPYIDPEICQVCPACFAIRSCNVRAILRIDLDEPPVVDASRCFGCRDCLRACPHGAILLDGAPPLY